MLGYSHCPDRWPRALLESVSTEWLGVEGTMKPVWFQPLPQLGMPLSESSCPIQPGAILEHLPCALLLPAAVGPAGSAVGGQLYRHLCRRRAGSHAQPCRAVQPIRLRDTVCTSCSHAVSRLSTRRPCGQ